MCSSSSMAAPQPREARVTEPWWKQITAGPAQTLLFPLHSSVDSEQLKSSAPHFSVRFLGKRKPATFSSIWRQSCTDIRERFIQEKTAMAHCHDRTIKDLRALSVLGFVFNLFLMFLLMFFSRYSGTGLLSGTERRFSVTTRNLPQWHWANPLVDNYGSILLHLGFSLISPESHYLMRVTISQALTLLASAKSQVQHSGLIGSWLTREEK